MSFTIVSVASRLLGIPLALVMMLFSITCTGSDATGPESGGGSSSFSGLIDHLCTDLSSIPPDWIDTVKNMSMHYAHTSHGSQLTTGLDLIESDDATYDVEIGSSYLPDVTGALCIFDGQVGDTYITPDMFWETASGMDMTRAVLSNNPSITVCMWCWCCQLDYYGQTEVQAYLDSMSVLESEYPSVIFVYMTGNAQNTGSEGYNRYQRNRQIRQYCENNDKILYDFADLDSWWYNSSSSQWEQNTYSYSGSSVPLEHSQFNGDEAGHTTYESCR
ncbi:MAG: hypothetical protein GF388_01180, partial [Candidatus Aegiribacteria sp.]|nr:hypothetical protein [Candidatus Aegiribacteria sp.]MBD3293996.1 hypothetical protein [Candidatus Fermentibacteria bacterium]